MKITRCDRGVTVLEFPYNGDEFDALNALYTELFQELSPPQLEPGSFPAFVKHPLTVPRSKAPIVPLIFGTPAPTLPPVSNLKPKSF